MAGLKRAECDRTHIFSQFTLYDLFQFVCVLWTRKTNKLQQQIITQNIKPEIHACSIASHHTPRCVYTQIIPKYECEHQPSVWWVKHQIAHCDSSVLHTTMQIIFQFRTKFNLNGDKIGYNANQMRFSLVLECYQMWNDEGVVHVRTVCIRTCTCVRVTSVRINDKVISFWMIRKHSSFYEPSPKTQWQILSLATGPSKISSTAINAHSPHSINHLDTAHLHHPHDSSSLFAASVCLFISLSVVCKR